MIVGRSTDGGLTLRTTDAGLSWQLVGGPTSDLDHKVVRMQNAIYATVLTSTGTITTSDGGATWQQEQMFEGEILSDMDFVSTGRAVIVGLKGAVYWSGNMVSGVGEERRVMPWEKLRGPMLH